MAYYVSHTIAIRSDGLDATELSHLKTRVFEVADEVDKDLREEIEMSASNIPEGQPCISDNLTGPKGSFVVLAGCFNYWEGASVDEFCKRISAEFETAVMHMEWNEEREAARCNVWHHGRKLCGAEGNYAS